MKTYAERPALRAFDVTRWVRSGILHPKRISHTSLFFLRYGKSVRQTWYAKTKAGNVTKHTAVTYLRQGCFLVPRWIKIPKWEIEIYQKAGIDLISRGIHHFRNIEGYHQLIFLQVEDLMHAERQQDHILDRYLTYDYLRHELSDLMTTIEHEEAIVHQIIPRRVGLEALHFTARRTLEHEMRNLISIISYAPVFTGNYSEKNKDLIVGSLRRTLKTLKQFSFKPISRRLGFARRSLGLAIAHLENGCPNRAKKRVESALKNMAFPMNNESTPVN